MCIECDLKVETAAANLLDAWQFYSDAVKEENHLAIIGVGGGLRGTFMTEMRKKLESLDQQKNRAIGSLNLAKHQQQACRCYC